MKKLLKIFIILNIITCTFFLNLPYIEVNAFSDIFDKADQFLDKGTPENAISESTIKEMSDTLYKALFAIGVVIAVGVGIFIGIQFMTGGVEQKAKVKETLIAYVAGCIVIFGAFTIWQLIVTIMQNST